MKCLTTAIDGILIVVPTKHADARGFFSEIYSRQKLVDAGIVADFVQDNHSLSADKGVVRGLHYQIAPMAQDKLVRVTRGAILDIAVDIRRGSATFGQHVAAVLSADNWHQAFIPAGFAHGFVTLQNETEVIYKVTNYYSPEHERGLRWNDPALGIDWGIDESAATMSARDREHPLLKDLRDLF